MNTCRHCRDAFEKYPCPLCEDREVNDACPECHAELKHGIIGPPLSSRSAQPDRATATDILYHGE